MPHSKHISDELNGLQSSLGPQGHPGNGFAVPDGYFDGFAMGMLAKVQLMDELETLSPLLANAPRINPYQVPPDYFATLDPMVPNREEEVSPLLAGLRKKQTFSLPEGYFDQLARESQDEPAKVLPMHAPSEELSPLLAGITRRMPYAVPEDYFATLDPMQSIDQASSIQQSAKVVRMGGFKWKQLAAAASVLLILTLGTFLYQDRQQHTKDDLASIPTEAIIDVVGDPSKQVISSITASDAEAISQLVKSVSAKDIQAFLNEVGTSESDMDDDPLLN